MILAQPCPYFSVLAVSLELETFDHPSLVGKVDMAMQAGCVIFFGVDVNIILTAYRVLFLAPFRNCQEIIHVIIMIFDVENKNLHLFVGLCGDCLALRILHQQNSIGDFQVVPVYLFLKLFNHFEGLFVMPSYALTFRVFRCIDFAYSDWICLPLKLVVKILLERINLSGIFINPSPISAIGI